MVRKCKLLTTTSNIGTSVRFQSNTVALNIGLDYTVVMTANEVDETISRLEQARHSLEKFNKEEFIRLSGCKG